MDEQTIENKYLKATVLAKGAELCSIINKQTQYQYMWQANPLVWPRHSPVLFPVVGKLHSNKISIGNQQYQLNQHGFARDCVFTLQEIYPNKISYLFKATPQTHKLWPFEFVLIISYEILDNSLITTYTVINKDNVTMPFSIGGHPGFNLPHKDLSQYQIVFNNDDLLHAVKLYNGLISNQMQVVGSGGVINLTKDAFKNDAMVFKNLKSNKVTLKHKSSTFYITMQFANFNYFGIWNKYPTEEFICLEPWAGIADNVNATGNINQKEGIIFIEPNNIKTLSYTTIFGS